MTLEEIYFVSQITSAITVVFSVIYLAAQIRSNNKILRSQGHYNALVLGQRPFEMMIENEDLAQLVHASASNPFALSDEDWSRVSAYIFMQLNSWEYLYYQNLETALPEQLWNGADAWYGSQARENAGWTRFWQNDHIAFGEPFASHVQKEILKSPTQNEIGPDVASESI